MKILLDTDIGTNIDDALCLAYLLAQPECELLGITTVTGQAEARAAMARWLCVKGDISVPVFPGMERSLTGTSMQKEAPQASLLAGAGEIDLSHASGHNQPFLAIDFLRSTIRAYPGEITLITIGPLTNAALLFLLDPEIPSLLQGMVSMAGVFSDKAKGIRPRETNVNLDTLGAYTVFRNAPGNLKVVSLDVTLNLSQPGSEMAPCSSLPLLRDMALLMDNWFLSRREIVFHDPLAAAVLFDDSICVFERKTVAFDTTDSEPRSIPVNIAISVDKDRFFKEFYRPFSGLL